MCTRANPAPMIKVRYQRALRCYPGDFHPQARTSRRPPQGRRWPGRRCSGPRRSRCRRGHLATISSVTPAQLFLGWRVCRAGKLRHYLGGVVVPHGADEQVLAARGEDPDRGPHLVGGQGGIPGRDHPDPAHLIRGTQTVGLRSWCRRPCRLFTRRSGRITSSSPRGNHVTTNPLQMDKTPADSMHLP